MMDLIPHPRALVLFLVKAKIFDSNRLRYNFCCLGDLNWWCELGAKLTIKSDLATCIKKCYWGHLRDQ
jgi:hypothetical protein